MPLRFILFFLLLFTTHVYSQPQDGSFEDLEGNKHSLDDYIGKGKWVIVNIWATACPYCRRELDTLSFFHEDHKDKDAIVLGLTLDWPTFGFPEKEYLRNFALENFIEFPLFMVDGELASKVIGKPVDLIPLTFFYNPSGELVHRVNGVVERDKLEAIIQKENTTYQLEWAKEIPPVFKP